MKKWVLLIWVYWACVSCLAAQSEERTLYQRLKAATVAAQGAAETPDFAGQIAAVNPALSDYQKAGGKDRHLQAASNELFLALNCWAKAKLQESSAEVYQQYIREHRSHLRIADSEIKLYETQLNSGKPH